ncbi:NAD(P)-binding oxidoreductase [Limosilactobacillus reuteri]|uniref:NAD(P)-dependent oxidoreductase n=1 Tax=Limosilactobacillus reuteri TaxID=1598 RepID=A0AAX2SN20_LIMRT|nr:NAD(P)-binding oxidoreductase [Limosilactobacillus reuteri]MDK8116996.1 SDR family oxidoreductase [Limosilactobacillus reuteri]RMX28147.1 NAD(P)-dependent oxidoreductase [Limosilactobacillus reuteri]TGB09588.1 NAD(P)-dependent oxidoreductase [Limosilactobacillus reuteri]
MENILIIGASGHVGKALLQVLLDSSDNNKITAIARHASSQLQATTKLAVIDADATDSNQLQPIVENQDKIFIAVSGQVEKIGETVIRAARHANVKKVVFIASMGIYNEIPTDIPYDNLDKNPILRPYRKIADDLEKSGLDYTIIRPGWFSDGPVKYEVTQKGEPFGGLNVSVASIAEVAKRALINNDFSKQSIGINTPEED